VEELPNYAEVEQTSHEDAEQSQQPPHKDYNLGAEVEELPNYAEVEQPSHEDAKQSKQPPHKDYNLGVEVEELPDYAKVEQPPHMDAEQSQQSPPIAPPLMQPEPAKDLQHFPPLMQPECASVEIVPTSQDSVCLLCDSNPTAMM